MSSASTHVVRRTGFSAPTNVFQVASWALFISFVAFFYALLVLFPSPAGAQAGWGVAFGVVAVITAAAAVVATAADPSDPVLHAPAPPASAAAPAGAYCYYCERTVHESSKHCVECWKRVPGRAPRCARAAPPGPSHPLPPSLSLRAPALPPARSLAQVRAPL